MEIRIGENVRRMRGERGVTQEELASFVGVSFQAVSKWERGDGLPDLTLLPTLAGYFNVTLDELVGMDAIRDTAAADELIEAVYRNNSDGKIAENLELLRDGVRRFPNNFMVWRMLASTLTSLRTDTETSNRNNAEAIEIYERILAHCTDSAVRGGAQAALCYAYDAAGMRDKAAKIAKTLPGVWNCGLIEVDFLDGEEKRKALSNCFLMVADALDWQFYRLHNLGGLTARERVELCEKALTVLEAVLCGEYYHLAVNMSERNLWLAMAYAELGENDKSLDALENAVEYAYDYDHQPEMCEYETLLLRGMTFKREHFGKDYAEPYSYWLLKYTENSVFDSVRGGERFISLTEKLRKNL